MKKKKEVKKIKILWNKRAETEGKRRRVKIEVKKE